MYKVIYDPDGVMFEVPPHKVGELVLNLGWTQTPPLPVAEPKKTTKTKAKASKPKPRSVVSDKTFPGEN